jgi:tRNA threonylcarbamoyl adenosine modification protein YjeE
MVRPFLTLDLPDEGATAALAEYIATCLEKGDVVALRGDLGAGKTTFARALIRALAGDVRLEVPSPTFTLVQTYQTPRLSVAHVDLYRIGDAREIEDAGLLDASTDVVVIEWPERASGLLPPGHLEVALEIAGSGRRARLSGGPSWRERLAGLRPAGAAAT